MSSHRRIAARLIDGRSTVGQVAVSPDGRHVAAVVATTNLYTENEDLSMADLVVNCLGDTAGPRALVRPGTRHFSMTDGCVHARNLVEWFSEDK